MVFLGGCHHTRTAHCPSSVVWYAGSVVEVCSKSSNISLSRLRRGLGFSMPPTGPFVRISLQLQYKVDLCCSYNTIRERLKCSRVMIGSYGICGFLGWGGCYVAVGQSGRNVNASGTSSPLLHLLVSQQLLTWWPSIYAFSIQMIQRAKVIWTGQY